LPQRGKSSFAAGGVFEFPGNIENEILSLVNAPFAALDRDLFIVGGNADYDVLVRGVDELRAEGGVGLLILNACALDIRGQEYVIGVDEVVDHNIRLVLSLTVVRPLEEIGLCDLVGKNRAHTVESLVRHPACALGGVAREDELLAAVTDDHPDRGNVGDVHLILAVEQIVGAEVALRDLKEQIWLCPVGVGGQDLDLGAAEIIEEGLLAVGIEGDDRDLGVGMVVADDLHDLVRVIARNVDRAFGKIVDGGHDYAVDGESGVADDVLEGRADVVDVKMRDDPVEVKNSVGANDLAQLKQTVEAVGVALTAVVEHIVSVEGKDEAVGLLELLVSDRIYTKYVVAKSKIMGKIGSHFWFLSEKL